MTRSPTSKLRTFRTDRLHDAGPFMPEHQRVFVHAGEMAAHQLAVGGIAEAGHLGLHQGLVGAGRRGFQVDQLDPSRLDDGDSSHGRFMWFICRVGPASLRRRPTITSIVLDHGGPALATQACPSLRYSSQFRKVFVNVHQRDTIFPALRKAGRSDPGSRGWVAKRGPP